MAPAVVGGRFCRNLRIRADPTPFAPLCAQCPRRSGARRPARQRVPVVLILRLRHAHEPGQQTDGRLSDVPHKSIRIRVTKGGRARHAVSLAPSTHELPVARTGRNRARGTGRSPTCWPHRCRPSRDGSLNTPSGAGCSLTRYQEGSEYDPCLNAPSGARCSLTLPLGAAWLQRF